MLTSTAWAEGQAGGGEETLSSQKSHDYQPVVYCRIRSCYRKSEADESPSSKHATALCRRFAGTVLFSCDTRRLVELVRSPWPLNAHPAGGPARAGRHPTKPVLASRRSGAQRLRTAPRLGAPPPHVCGALVRDASPCFWAPRPRPTARGSRGARERGRPGSAAAGGRGGNAPLSDPLPGAAAAG